MHDERVCTCSLHARARGRAIAASNLLYASSVAVIPAAIDFYKLTHVQLNDCRRVARRWRSLSACERPFRSSAGRLAIGTLVSCCACEVMAYGHMGVYTL